jgi:hypothetical protein
LAGGGRSLKDDGHETVGELWALREQISSKQAKQKRLGVMVPIKKRVGISKCTGSHNK